MKFPRAGRRSRSPLFLAVFAALLIFATTVEASYGDRMPEFRECVQVGATKPAREMTPPKHGLRPPEAASLFLVSPRSRSATIRTALQAKMPPRSPKRMKLTELSLFAALHRRLLLWTCSSECDYTCQHIITKKRVAAGERVVQFHGKWPFHRFLGCQEPFSTIFSLGNLWAHYDGLRKFRAAVPASYPLMPWYTWLAAVGVASWTFSAIFHTRDFAATEQLDYFAAGANVLYGLYYTVVRVMRLDRPTPRRRSVLRAWTLLCVLLYAGHVAYLKGVRWDYTYNMAANVVVGVIQNLMWLWFSYNKYRQTRRVWAIWPSIVVAIIVTVMSLELFDFPPLLGALDAHSLWHLGTIPPTILMYRFLIKDAQDDMAGSERLKS